MKKLFGILTLVAVILSSCGEDENQQTGNLTAEQASTEINQIVDQIDNDIIEIVESEGVQALEDFTQLFDDVDSFEGGRARPTRLG